MTKDEDKDKAEVEVEVEVEVPFPFFKVEETLKTCKFICEGSLNYYRSVYPTSKLKDDKKDEEKDKDV
jgi:hypothetical protein